MKITIKDIARMAEVSTATVSKVLNGKDHKISQSTRERVLGLAHKNNYVPNRIASSLVTRKTKTLGLIIPDIANPFFPGIARGAEDFANQAGYSVILCNTDDDAHKEERYIQMLEEKMVDGIIYTASAARTDPFTALKKVRVPVITVDREIIGVATHGKIVVNNNRGAFEAVTYLISRGYRRIVHITGPLTTKTAWDRYEGYQNALQAAGFKEDPTLVLPGEFNSAWGYAATCDCLKRNLHFDAIFGGNDLIAIGALKALKKNGIDIPVDVGIVGFDDIPMADLVEPELTTIHQPHYEMGYKAATVLVKLIDEDEGPYPDSVLPTRLIVRNSTR